MNIKYFHDTDTALLEFSNRPVERTRERLNLVAIDPANGAFPCDVVSFCLCYNWTFAIFEIKTNFRDASTRKSFAIGCC